MSSKKIKDKERDSIDFGKSRIGPLFTRIFYPTLLSMVFASLFTVADGIFVGQGVGSNALAAINIVSPLFLITTGLALMFGVGVSVVASIHLSQNNNKAANINITQAFDVATLCMLFRGLVFLVPAFILMPIFIYPQGMWLAVPVAECMTLGVILLTSKGIISR